MKENNELLYITFMDIRIFLTCARYSNFTKAAEKLGVTPGMVSKRIQALENATGVRLFIREKNKVVLSAAGRESAIHFKNLLDNYIYAIEKAHHIQNGNTDPIVFAINSTTNMERYFIPLISSFESDNFSFSFKTEIRDDFDVMDDLLNGNIDVAFAPLFMEKPVLEAGGLSYILAVPSPLYAGLSQMNPLAEKEHLTLEDFKNVGLVMPTREKGYFYTKWLNEICKEKGFSPKVDYLISDPKTAHLNINDENAIIIDKYSATYHSSLINYREIEGTKSGLLMIWKTDCRSIVKEFTVHAKEFYLDLKS